MWQKMVLNIGLLACFALSALGGYPAPARDMPGAPLFILTLDGKLVYHDGTGPQIPEWEPWIGPGLETCGSRFGLDFGDHKEMLKQAEKLYGKKVRVTGRLEKRTLQGLIPHQIDVLVVSDLKPTVTLQAKLHYVITEWDTGKVLFTCDRVPELFCKCWSLRYGVTIDGKLYVLDFAGNTALGGEAEKLAGKLVVATGTLKAEVVTVTSLKPVP
jgi:hypothetical protein